MKPTYREKNLLDYLFGGSTLCYILVLVVKALGSSMPCQMLGTPVYRGSTRVPGLPIRNYAEKL